MVYVHVDDRARICLTREIVDKYGKEYLLLEIPGKIVLIPVPKDPLKALQEEGKKIPKNLSPADLKRMGREDAENDALKKLQGRTKRGND